ncbi:discoidin domain-containing protein [Paenibacillus sp. J2TS4]|uniref:discoidin domain-containing protein n=1 Tax=Paenibacillus sp. J2TS4 TaxID=2807194 RepID=UPI001B08720C|nr:discoidin domain-containing protein [Paenibacillus sp. J2TS4]GIP35004.1 hypothetical protein J2TS4_42140 [Paenibacillus sp. J2TS4]
MYKKKVRVSTVSILVITLLLVLLVMDSNSILANNKISASNKDTVTFSVEAYGESVPSNPHFRLELRCGEQTEAQAVINSASPKGSTLPHHAAGRICTIRATTDGGAILGNEVVFTIRQDDDVLARHVAYPDGGPVVSTEFYVPQGELTVEVTHEFASGDLGTPVRAMTWNLWEGGRAAGGEENIQQIIEVIRHENPDILFTVETYRSGEKILAGLNEGLPENQQYTGIKISNEPAHQPDKDNLWIFSRYPVIKQYPVMYYQGLMNSFHFGGIKVELPDGQEVNLFNAWIYHEGCAWCKVNLTVGEITYNLPRTNTNAEIVATDLVRRIEHIRKIVHVSIPTLLEGDTAPVLLAGDFNTLSHYDWSERFADAPGHAGLVLQWPVTQILEDAGFIDSFRWANPDAGKDPGNTWSPYYGYGMAPGRIDYIWSRGDEMRITDSYVRDQKLPEHENDQPFYSDHAAVITDLMIRNTGSLPSQPEPKPYYVPQKQMTAVSTSEHTGYEASKAIDGNQATMWHSEWSPKDPLPQSITIDLGGIYDIVGLDYQTRADFKPDGIITGYRIYASTDGVQYTEVLSGAWDRDYFLKKVDFSAPGTRYLRLEAVEGSGGVASAAEINIRYQPSE